MVRVFCDGCYHRGEHNDLTGRNDYARVPFLGSRARILDLCKENGCLDAYHAFEQRTKLETREHAANYKRMLDGLIGKFWEDVKRGSPEEAEKINAAKSGAKVGAL